ncbi:tRNA(Ile)-lysidine synthetase [Hyphomonas neptunium ATCC 15444]|uniref:tRNA(Ile)-lysidine synthase n=2 Tax=Hyphomonas TaxID=85 RepID=TILS_HYPNA|nr:MULTISPECIES: tRNA lysidine(34) synthetase TilS [Hyphomonas]Q0C5V2.1 RecName: Full=tRNA(Ile)-lysidine synthase; AltName: Full=tRNA(Ile)-2-lysyl-cytidine synthase; AltName: Full=tRNA(Ile)-lysidine synthetase [Hyphomonas neptunium ATCC 15444]ABI77716.1 tRNA(Ile)-lysidine synthetase [Hyphomonas neptunium ATCC 15444]KCZ89358.1 tRNA(Ile)-lysidine synthetase [Hyphomonas hirschiana VP5]
MLGLGPQQAAFEAALGALPDRLLDTPVGVAVSGGSDSLALLILAHRWAARRGRVLRALTVDHGLRPESRAEAEAVGRLCADMGIEHDILRLEGAAPRQSALRRGRHAALARTIADKSGHLLLTGHTADDQAETFLMRARQGSGWYGLAGMRPLSLSPVWPEGEGVFIARPLLGIRREALRAFLRDEGLGWADDPSNDNPAFERVRMRRLLCPEMSRNVPVLSLVDRFQTLRMIEDGAIWRWMTANVRAGEAGIHVASFAGHPPERAARALGMLLQIAAGREMPPRGESLRRLAEEIVSKGDFRGATLGGCRITARRTHICLKPECGPLPPGTAARLAATQAILSGNPNEIAASAGKESFLEDLVPIF